MFYKALISHTRKILVGQRARTKDLLSSMVEVSLAVEETRRS